MRLTRENTVLVLDSSVDLPGATPPWPGWRIVPQYVSFEEASFRDHVDLSPAEFFRRIAVASELPHTAHPSPGEFAAVLESVEWAERVLVIVLSAALSGTYETALLAADARTRVIDSGTISGGVRLLAEAVERRLERGTSDEEVDALVERYRERACFFLALENTLYLARGGRAGQVEAARAQLRPIVELAGGDAVVVGTVSTRGAARARLVRALAERSSDGESLHVGVAHAATPVEAERLTERVRQLRPRASLAPPIEIGPAVGTHSGPGALALYWFDDTD